jgi:DNA polymerase III alpha subunit
MLMKTDSLGIPRFTNKDLIDMIYTGHSDKVHVVLCEESDDIDKFNEACQEQGLNKLQKYIPLDVDEKTFDGVCQSEWFMPDKYKAINVYEYVLQKAETPCPQHVQDRIWEELDAFKERSMLDLLRYMIYLVDFMRENDIVWGVGRGSSVASYVLYLIGVHKINSIQFGLDWREFLR